MQLYNTLTRSITEVIPQHAPKITVYTCGPTVYDYAHIGHWFNYIRMDILIRALKLEGYEPVWVMNITDVGHLVSDADEGEDKLEKGARREGKTAWQVAAYYTADFLDCMQQLQITTPDHITKATDHITQQIALIQQLEAKGFTYVIDDGVYYDTAKFPSYADFARLDLEGQQAGARVEQNQQKRNPTDFALWKFSPLPSNGQQRDMQWQSPWTSPQGQDWGFPGWHIECSAMSMHYLGDTLDIHTGGIDHVPVHHTNEIAQSEAASGQRFANHWMHGNHVMVDGEKISKSLGNGIRLQQLVNQGVPPMAVRLHVLESHYRSQSQFTLNHLQAAQQRLKHYYAAAVMRWQLQPADTSNPIDYAHALITDLREPLLHDLNTAQVLANLGQRFDSVIEQGIPAQELRGFEDYLAAIDAALGLDLSRQPDITDSQKAALMQRQQARSDKDWHQADKLRDDLASQGIGLRDSGQQVYWYRL